jgi:hypothetical protein
MMPRMGLPAEHTTSFIVRPCAWRAV